MRHTPLFSVLSLALLPTACGHQQCKHHDAAHHDMKAHHGEQHHENGRHEQAPMVHRFDDAQKWSQRFEDPARDAWQKPDLVIEAMDLDSSMYVADIGSATGYFPVRIAKRVPNGRVWGVDIEPDMIRYLNKRAHDEGLANLVSALGAANDPLLPEPVDRILMVDTYHHIGERVAYLQLLKSYLKPGGQVVVVDFKKQESPMGPPLAHKMAQDVVEKEFAAAGYTLSRSVAGLEHQYVLIFDPNSH